MARITGLAARIQKENMKLALEGRGHVFFEKGNYNLNIIGIRNDSGNAKIFDDSLVVLYKVKSKWVCDIYDFTTEPGTRLLKVPQYEGGTAILVPDQYRGTYRIGTHRTYTALVQRNSKVRIWRDDNKDTEPDYVGPEQEGFFGINIHKHSGPDNRKYTGGVSAGCQVFRSSRDFYEFMDTCDKAAEKWGNGFTYTLIEEKYLINNT